MSADRIKRIDEDRAWSERDIFDLKNGLILGKPIAEIADFLCRRKDEIRAKARELNLPVP